jgi:hypothetical protein
MLSYVRQADAKVRNVRTSRRRLLIARADRQWSRYSLNLDVQFSHVSL